MISYQTLPEEGALLITTSQGVHRINSTEIHQVAGAGSAVQRFDAFVGKQASGASLPDSILNNLSSISDIYQKNAYNRYVNRINGANQNYGGHAKPVPMTGAGGGTPSASLVSKYGS